MLKNISSLGSVLNTLELQSIKGGRIQANGGVTVTCTFSDGASWAGSTTTDFQPMIAHCRANGGTVELSPA